MNYKDQAFCGDWCGNTECFRNYSHIEEAQKEGNFLNLNPWMPVAFFVEKPVDCTKWKPKENEELQRM